MYFLTGLKDSDPSGVNASFRKFVQSLQETLLQETLLDDNQIFENLGSAPTIFDEEILNALDLTIKEASICYKHECFMATIVLCGKMLETVLAHAYEWLTNENPFEKQRSFAYMRRKLREDYKVLLDKTVDNQLDIVYTRRSAAVHGNTKIPTKDEAHGVAIFTQNVINIIYQYFNDENNFN